MQHERAGYGKEKLNGRVVDSRHDGDSRGELCKSHHADNPDDPFYASPVADSF